MLGLGAGGCSYQLGSLVGNDDEPVRSASSRLVSDSRSAGGNGAPDSGQEAGDPETTGAIPGGSDLTLARTALADALGRSGSAGSTSWENPTTGARGTVTPLGRTGNNQGDRVCRSFLASHVQDGRETWLEGIGCRGVNGRWEIRSLRPWKQG